MESAFHIISHAEPEGLPLLLYQQRLLNLLETKPVGLHCSEGEKLFELEIIERVFTDDGQGNGRLIPEQLVVEFKSSSTFRPTLEEAREIARTHPDKNETTAILLNLYEQMNNVIRETPWTLRQKGTDYEKEAQRLTEKASILRDPVMGRIAKLNHECKAYADALIATLAIVRHRLDRGAPPETLKSLVKAGYVRQLPPDPYSNGSLVYKRFDSEFTLYSVGMDFKDDGGKHVGWSDEPGDYVFWPVQEK